MTSRKRRVRRRPMSAAQAMLPLALLAALSLAPARVAADAGSCASATFASAGPAHAIPDPGSAESTVVVPAGDPVAAVAVQLTILHPFDSDLRLELVSPAGRVVQLAGAVGMWGQDFADTVFDDAASTSIISHLPPFTGRFRPVEPLAAFVGTPREGPWKLRVSDLRGRYAGTLESWRLDLTSCTSPQPPPATPGAPEPPPLPTGVPSGHVPVAGTLILVTTNSDDLDGDVSSVANLKANPGADGLSLREAILATNNDPGSYTVRFAQLLSGGTIHVGSAGVAGGGELPPLSGGGVLIDGDIDGDGRPDVTINGQGIAQGGRCGICGLAIISSANRLHALTLEHFSVGVFFAPSGPGTVAPPLPSHQTFASNVVSGLVLTDITGGPPKTSTPAGIALRPAPGHSECSPIACETHNRWIDARFIGNTIESSSNGIEVQLEFVSGDALERTTVAGNHIRIGTPGSAVPKFGLNIAAGGWGGANENRVSDALVAYNDIEAGGQAYAINFSAGYNGGSANVVEDLRVVANHVHFSGVPAVRAASRAIGFAISDGCAGGPGIACSKDDVVRRVEIVGNLLEGQDNAGVLAADPCCSGVAGSSLTDLRIANNVIKGIVPPHELNPWGIVIASHVDVSNVIVDSNTIEQQTTEPEKEHAAYLAGGGVALLGGLGAGPPGSIRHVSVTNNRIDTDLTGIAIVGGGPSDDDSAFNASGHSISDVHLAGNVIGRVPVLANRWDSKAKGINVIGGLGGTPPATGRWRSTTGNSVTSITLASNLVAGVVDSVSVRSNFGQGASGNVAALGLRPPTLAISRAGSGTGTVTSEPLGIQCGTTCSHEFDDRSDVTLTASSAVGSTFAGWSGDCSGSGTCALAMSANRSATATFESDKMLTVRKSGSGSGAVRSTPGGIACGPTCSRAYTHGIAVTLTASASGGSRFGGWSGACSGRRTCSLTMSANRSATATFTRLCTVPRVKGKRLAAARKAIAKAKCKIGKISNAFSAKRKGAVVSQRPAPGAKLPRNPKVNLVVSKGKRP